MMKKTLVLMLCAVLILSVFGGCAAAPAETTAPETTAPVEASLSVG